MKNDIGCSEYVHKIVGVEFSPAPAFDLDEEYKLQQKVAELIESGIVSSVHDISEGGLFVTLCEKGFNRNIGFDIKTDNSVRKDAFLFGEAQSRVIVSVSAEKEETFRKMIGNFSATEIGTVTKETIHINGENWGSIVKWKELYETAIEKHLAKELESEAALSLQ